MLIGFFFLSQKAKIINTLWHIHFFIWLRFLAQNSILCFDLQLLYNTRPLTDECSN